MGDNRLAVNAGIEKQREALPRQGMKDFSADVPAPCRHGYARGVKNET